MRTKLTAVAALLIGLTLNSTGRPIHSSEPTVPSVLGDDRWPAAWVAADVAVTPDGSLRADLLKEHTASLLRHAAFNTERAVAASKSAEPDSAARAGDAVDECQAFLGTVPVTL